MAAVASTALGLAAMAAGGAPGLYLVVNAAALGTGLLALVLLTRWRISAAHAGWLALAAACALLATAGLGTSLGGVTRWVPIGPLSLQPSLILLPAMLIAHARQRSPASTAAMLVAAAALACQPDRAGAAALAAGLLVAGRRDRGALGVLAAALAGLAVTLIRPDPLPPQRFVEHVLADGLAASLPLGAALVAGAALLVLPAVRLPAPAAQVFAAVWLALVLASVVGPYPTPLLGYGSSSILGYLLCVAALPPGRAVHPPAQRH